MCLPRPQRITRGSEYAAVRQHGRSHAGRWLVLGIMEDATMPGFKAGFIVPKTVGGAVQRNLTKRRLREIVRATTARLPEHHYVVTIARRGAADQDFQTLRREWHWLARKTGLIPRDPAA